MRDVFFYHSPGLHYIFNLFPILERLNLDNVTHTWRRGHSSFWYGYNFPPTLRILAIKNCLSLTRKCHSFPPLHTLELRDVSNIRYIGEVLSQLYTTLQNLVLGFDANGVFTDSKCSIF